jgi:membrane-bound ClpP family serine protease
MVAPYIATSGSPLIEIHNEIESNATFVSLPIRITLQGEISKADCDEAEEILRAVPEGEHVDIVLSSSDGDLHAVWHLARTMARLRQDRRLHYTAHLVDHVLGPLALLPFPCQTIVTTPIVSWGAIGVHVKEPLPIPLLQAEIRAMVPADPALFEDRLAIGMTMLGTAEQNGEVMTQHELNHHPSISVGSDMSLADVPRPDESEETALSHLRLAPNSIVGRIVINDRKQGINEATWIYVKAAIDRFKQTKPACVILELNTPGGEVFAAQRISNALRSLDTKDGIPVIAYVNNWAISAGAMLAYSCRYIVVAPDASMGAATPVVQTQEGMEVAPEKVNSALRTDFANRAAFFGRNADIARAMVDPDIILVRRGGRIIALSSEDEIRKGALVHDELISAKGKLLTLTAEQMRDLGVADWVISKEVAEAPDEEMAEGESLSRTVFRDIPPLAAVPGVRVETFHMDMKTNVVAFLASPAVSSLLVFVAFVCFYIEMTAPGVTLPGIIGGVSVVLLLLGSFAQETVTWFEPLCIVAGVIIIGIELIAFPTMGALLILGGVLMFVGVIGIVVPGIGSVRFEGASINAAGEYVLYRLAWISGAFLAALGLIVLLSRRLSLKILRLSGMILEQPTHVAPVAGLNIDVGDRAIVAASLRPAGKIEFHGIRIDAVSEGSYIESGTRVRVVSVRGGTVVVEPLEG